MMGEYTDKKNQVADMTIIVYNKEYLIDGDYLLLKEFKIPLHQNKTADGCLVCFHLKDSTNRSTSLLISTERVQWR